MKKSKKSKLAKRVAAGEVHPLQLGCHRADVNGKFAYQIAHGILVVEHNGFKHPRPTPPES